VRPNGLKRCSQLTALRATAPKHQGLSRGAPQSASNVVRATLASDNLQGNEMTNDLAVQFKSKCWQKLSMKGQGIAIGVTALSTAVVLDSAHFPAPIRMFLLSYALATSVEWAYHKYNMHGVDDVHILHHSETNDDMSMPQGYNINAIQFPLSASLQIAGYGIPLLAAVDLAFHLNIPLWYVPLASTAVAVSHAGLWNTLHPDTHEVLLEMNEKMSDSNGASYQPWLPRESWWWDWLILNHTGHHTIVGNYNCVFPGADCVFGTFYHLKPEHSDTYRAAGGSIASASK